MTFSQFLFEKLIKIQIGMSLLQVLPQKIIDVYSTLKSIYQPHISNVLLIQNFTLFIHIPQG